ncbi:MAG: Perilipin-3 [Candidatus Midichloria mitochondrii]|nr:hypothetical protein [Candidatus Midichloria mitochondrii]MDJ1288097.1 hypothetical protein [Candidatus Midichloria mitochondrii]
MFASSIVSRGITNLAARSAIPVISKTWENQQLAYNAALESAARSTFKNMAAFSLSALKEHGRAGATKVPAVFNTGLLSATATLLKPADVPASSMTSIARDIVKNSTFTFGTRAATSMPKVVVPNLLQTAESAVQDTIFGRIGSAVSASPVTDVTGDLRVTEVLSPVSTSISEATVSNLSQAAQFILPDTISGAVGNFIPDQSAAVAPALSELTELPDVSTSTVIERSTKMVGKAASAISADIENILPDLRYLLDPGSVSNAASAISSDIEDILPDLKCLLEPDSIADGLTSIPQKFPILQKPMDFSKMFLGEEPEFIKNFMEYLYNSGSYLYGLAVNACHIVSTALYNSYTYLYNFAATTYSLAIATASLVKDVVAYTYSGLSYAKDFATFCAVDHPYVVAGVVAFAVSAYLVKKYHVLDYAKTTAEISCCGIEAAVQIGCNTTVAAFSGACYLVDSSYSVCKKTWEYFSTSNDYKDDPQNDHTETSYCFCEY